MRKNQTHFGAYDIIDNFFTNESIKKLVEKIKIKNMPTLKAHFV